MNFIFDLINVPLSWVLNFIATLLGGSFAGAIAIFTLFVNLCTVPLSIKSQKSSVAQLRIKPKMEEIKKKYGDDKQKYNAEMQKLYQEENISMGGGCLPMIIRMIFMLSVYRLVTQPENYKYINADIMNYKMFGLDLTVTPNFGFNFVEAWQPIWLIPIGAFVVQMLTSIVSMKTQKKLNPDAPSMAGMMLTMPLITLFIGFTVPGAVGFYWLCSGLIGSVVQLAVQNFYGPQKMLAKERAGSIVRVYQEEKKYIEKRVAENNDENA